MTDNILSCSESPLKCPQLMDLNQIFPCISCTLRLNAEISGTGIVRKHDNGLQLDENPQTTLTINGIQHNLMESFIYVPGAHRLPGQQEPYPMEVALYFQSSDAQKHVALCIPVQVGVSNSYFEALNETLRDVPTVGSLVDLTAKILSYSGADMRGRTSPNSRPRSQCDPIARTVTYYVVMTPTTIAAVDYQRLTKIAKGASGPPVSITEITQSRYKLLSLIEGINVVKAKDKGISTNALKCYRLDKDKDVINDKVYIGGGGPGLTLDKELAGSDATQADGEDKMDTSVQPGDIEKWIGILIGVTIAILIVAFLIYILWSGTFRDYIKVKQMHDKSGSMKLPSFNLASGFKRFICPPTAQPPVITK